VSEKAQYSAKSRKMDAKSMHAAAEAELTRLEKEGGGRDGARGSSWSPSAAAALAAGLLFPGPSALPLRDAGGGHLVM